MKKLLIIALIFTIKCYSQNFTLSELLSLNSASVEKSIEILKNKGFKYIEGKEDKITLAYNYNKDDFGYDKEPKAQCWAYIFLTVNLKELTFANESKILSLKKELSLYKVDTKFYENYYTNNYLYGKHIIDLDNNDKEGYYNILMTKKE